MHDFLKSVRFKILVGILTVMVGFMIMAVYTGGTAPLISQIVSVVTAPMQRFSADIAGRASGFFDKFFNAGEIYDQNVALQEEISALRKQMVDYEKILHENEQLKGIQDMREQREDLAFETATVIARDPTHPFFAFTIDKGTLDDVKQYDPVIAPDGSLVGYVTEVGLTTAKVVTLLDVSINVGASNTATRDIGNVTGTVDLAAQGLCTMQYLPRDSKTEKGSIIATSGSTLFPKDIIIGEITAVNTSSGGNSLEAIIKPSAEIQKVKDVFVITHFEGQGVE